MTEISIKLDDRGWGVAAEVKDAGEDRVGGWSHGRVFGSFEEAVLAALDDVSREPGEVAIRLTRGAAKVASRELQRVRT